MRIKRSYRKTARRSFKSRYTKGGVRRHLRGVRKRGNSRFSKRGKPQRVRVSRGGIRL